MIVLWNTWYMQDALDERSAQGRLVRPEDGLHYPRLAFLRIFNYNDSQEYSLLSMIGCGWSPESYTTSRRIRAARLPIATASLDTAGRRSDT
jgi:hypothetical protein